MVLTDEQRADQYPAATMEAASASTEEALYSNLTSTRVDKPSGYPYDPYPDPNRIFISFCNSSRASSDT